jgi:gluconolactonase
MGCTEPKLKPRLALLAALLCCAVAAHGGESLGLVAGGAAPQKVKDGFSFTEGPAADLAGNVYFTDIPNHEIHRWDAGSNEVSLYRADFNEPNGLIFDVEGRLVICEMGKRRLVREEKDGEVTVLADNYDGKPINMPNDLWIDAEGGVYFSDFSGPQAGGQGLQVYYVSADGVVNRVTDSLKAPNGLIGTPDGKRLYITDPGAGKTWYYEILGPGELGPQQLFIDQFTDGMTLDEHDNVYFSGEDIRVYSPQGELLEKIPFPEQSTNLTFGGLDGTTLFVTGRNAVYTLDMAVAGAMTPLQLREQLR